MNIWAREYHCRFAPITFVDVTVADDDRQAELYANTAFLHAKAHPETVLVTLGHEREDRARPVGRLSRVWLEAGWWCAAFRLNPAENLACVAADRLEVGTPVSVGYDPIGSGGRSVADGALYVVEAAELRELAIAPRGGAIPGAQVVRILEAPQWRPDPQPAARSQPAGVSRSHPVRAPQVPASALAAGQVLRRDFGTIIRIR